MKRVTAFVLSIMLVAAPSVTFGGQADTDQVLRGIPAIAKAFAPLVGVKWEEFAQVLAGICAVESRCDPTYPHYTSSGAYSQYQGLFQMNARQVQIAQGQLPQMVQQMQAKVASGEIPQDAFQFVQQAIQQANQMNGRDLRFLPAYGIILGATKHIQLNKQLAERYPGDPIRQASGHLTAQFSGITEGKIRARQFNAPISGCATCTNTEAWALSVNRVNATGSTVAGAIEAAGAQYQSRMSAMIQRMAQVTNNLSLVPPNVAPFTPPQYNPGQGPLLDVPYSGVSTMMEGGLIPPRLAPGNTPPPTSVPPAINETLQTPQNLINQVSTSGTGASGGNQASLQLLLQPIVLHAGERGLVSWTSVGMRSGSCTVRFDSGATVSSASEGAEYFNVPATQSAGTISATLNCTTQNGQAVAAGASAKVE